MCAPPIQYWQKALLAKSTSALTILDTKVPATGYAEQEIGWPKNLLDGRILL